MTRSITITRQIHFRRARAGRKALKQGEEPTTPPPTIARISRLMALAIHMQELVDRGGSPTTPTWPASPTSPPPG